jgi:hypothetical protein
VRIYKGTRAHLGKVEPRGSRRPKGQEMTRMDLARKIKELNKKEGQSDYTIFKIDQDEYGRKWAVHKRGNRYVSAFKTWQYALETVRDRITIEKRYG